MLEGLSCRFCGLEPLPYPTRYRGFRGGHGHSRSHPEPHGFELDYELLRREYRKWLKQCKDDLYCVKEMKATTKTLDHSDSYEGENSAYGWCHARDYSSYPMSVRDISPVFLNC